jgi:hypothetical protein
MTPSVKSDPPASGERIWAAPLTPPLPGSRYIRKCFILVAPALAHIRHGWFGRVAGWYMIVIGLIMVVLGPALIVPFYLRSNPPFSLFSYLQLGALVVCLLHGGASIREGIANVTDRTVIDRPAGWIAREWLFGTAWTVHRSEVVAIQCLHAGWLRDRNDHHEHYQLNLVLADRTRLHVCGVESEEWVRELAGQLGDFLQLPLSDQIDESRTPKPSMWA